MPSLKALKNRIASVKSTRKITKAMQMVAAAKLRRAQNAAEAARPYAERMDKVLANLASGVAGDSAPRLLGGTGSDQVHLLLVCTAERGLCGALDDGGHVLAVLSGPACRPAPWHHLIFPSSLKTFFQSATNPSSSV